MSYRANQLSVPVRVGLMSSEEISGGRASPMTFGTLFPGFEALRQTLRRLNLNSHKGRDYTVDVEFQVAATKGPENGEGPQGSRLQETGPVNWENPAHLTKSTQCSCRTPLFSPV